MAANNCSDGAAGACMVVAYDAFKHAAAGRMSPSELGMVLREFLTGCERVSEVELCRGLKEFLDLDLGDYAYSLAIHDQAALDDLKARIVDWAGRLAEETGAKS